MRTNAYTSARGVALTQPGQNRFRRAFFDAWHGVTVREIMWTMAIGFCFIVSQGYALNSAPGRTWPIPIEKHEWFFAPSCLILLVAFRFAEHPLLASLGMWKRYTLTLALAIPLFFALEATLVGGAYKEHGFKARTPALMWAAVNISVIVLVGAAMYSSLARSRRSQAAFHTAALQLAVARRRVSATRLSAMQAQVDPTFLFSTLGVIEKLYESDPPAAEACLGNLIEFLRTALPRLGEHDSTIDREVRLARAYLEIVRVRMQGRLEMVIDLPYDLERASFPAMVIVPILELAVHAGGDLRADQRMVEIRARKIADRLQVFLLYAVHDGDDDALWQRTISTRLADIYGDTASLRPAAIAGRVGVMVDVPYEVALP